MPRIATLLSLILTLPLTLAGPAAAQTVGHGATATVPLADGVLPGGRADLWKALRWCVSLEDTVTEDPPVAGATAISVTVQYQKEKHLLCEIVPGGTDICSWFAGTAFAIDNSGKLDDWHTTLRYTGIPLGADDGSGNRAFSRDGVSGTVTTGDRLTALAVDRPGRVVFTKPPGDTALADNGGACR